MEMLKVLISKHKTTGIAPEKIPLNYDYLNQTIKLSSPDCVPSYCPKPPKPLHCPKCAPQCSQCR